MHNTNVVKLQSIYGDTETIHESVRFDDNSNGWHVKYIGISFYIMSQALYGINSLLMKYVYIYYASASVYEFSMVRSIFMLIISIPLIIFMKLNPFKVSLTAEKWLILKSILNIACDLTYVYSMQYLKVYVMVQIYSMFPIYLILAEWIMTDRSSGQVAKNTYCELGDMYCFFYWCWLSWIF